MNSSSNLDLIPTEATGRISAPSAAKKPYLAPRLLQVGNLGSIRGDKNYDGKDKGNDKYYM